MLELWASSLRDVKVRIRPLLTQARVAASAGLLLHGLLEPERRTTGVMREVDWLSGDRRSPGELRRPGVACVQRGGSTDDETRYYVSSAALDAFKAHHAVRGRWAIENSLHWVFDAGFGEDPSRLRKGFGSKPMALVRHFALKPGPSRKGQKSIGLRRKVAGWIPDDLDQRLQRCSFLFDEHLHAGRLSQASRDLL